MRFSDWTPCYEFLWCGSCNTRKGKYRRALQACRRPCIMMVLTQHHVPGFSFSSLKAPEDSTSNPNAKIYGVHACTVVCISAVPRALGLEHLAIDGLFALSLEGSRSSTAVGVILRTPKRAGKHGVPRVTNQKGFFAQGRVIIGPAFPINRPPIDCGNKPCL